MYNKERAKSIAKASVINYIPAGIIENVKLVSAKVDTSINGNDFLEIRFEKDGAIFVHTEYKPNRTANDTDETVQKKEDNQFSRMMQILLVFYKDEQLIFNGTTFKEFAKEVATFLNNANKDILVRVKIVYNDNNYTTLPRYTKYTFIEPMILPEGETSSIVELSIDKFTKSVVEDRETTVTNPLEPSSASVTDNLPF